MRIIEFMWCRLCNREFELGKVVCPKCGAKLIKKTKDLDVGW